MKKANMFIWLIAFSILPVISNAQNNYFSLNFYNSSKQLRFEHNTSYSMIPFAGWQMQLNNRNLEDKRIDFDQTSRSSRLTLSLSKLNRILKQEYLTGYEHLLDYSDLESELNPYSNKTGFLGYGLTLIPMDSLYLGAAFHGYYRQEEDRYIKTHELISHGIYEQVNAGFSTGEQTKFLHTSFNFESKNLDWEKFSSANAGISGNLTFGRAFADCFVNAGTRNENLYVLNAPDSISTASYYDMYDRQFRNSLSTGINLSLPWGDYVTCQLQDSYNLINYKHDINKFRNNGDYENLAVMNLTYQLGRNLLLSSNNRYSYYIKDLSYISNTRITDVRTANCSLQWEYLTGDSLQADYTVELRRTSYPDSDHELDNDYLSNTWKLGWIMYWKDRIRLANHVLVQQREEVFIDSWLSANNNTLTGLVWQPEIDALIGDCLVWQQDYQIRADYDNYLYNDFSGIQDTFYRQASTGWHLIYDSTPIAAKTSLSRWNILPYRKREISALRIDLGYAWERNETSARDGGVYYVNGRYDRQTISLLLQKQIGILIGQIYPKYSWGNWKEYNLLLSSALRLNQNSTLEFNLNPLGPELRDLDWRASCSVNLSF